MYNRIFSYLRTQLQLLPYEIYYLDQNGYIKDIYKTNNNNKYNRFLITKKYFLFHLEKAYYILYEYIDQDIFINIILVNEQTVDLLFNILLNNKSINKLKNLLINFSINDNCLNQILQYNDFALAHLLLDELKKV